MNSDNVNTKNPIEIPNKSTFKVHEVCALTGIKSYVLRFWESEFDEISPITSSSGQKLYEQKDIEAVLVIKKLLFEDKHTIERARVEIKKLISNRELIENIYESAEFFSNENSADSYLYDDADEGLADLLDKNIINTNEAVIDMNYSKKYDVKKLDPEVIQTLKDKFMTSADSTLETLENSTQAMNEAGSSDKGLQPSTQFTQSAHNALTIRTLNDHEFKKLLLAKSKLKEMLEVLESKVTL